MREKYTYQKTRKYKTNIWTNTAIGEAEDQMSLELGAMRSSLMILLLVTSGLCNPIYSNNKEMSRLANPIYSNNKEMSRLGNHISSTNDNFKKVGFAVHNIR